MRPMYWSGSTSESATWRLNTWKVEATAPAAAPRRDGGAFPSTPLDMSARLLESLESSHLSRIAFTASSEVASLDTRSRTASAGLASWDNSDPTDAK